MSVNAAKAGGSERVLGLKSRAEPQRVAKLASRFYNCIIDSDDLSPDQQSYLLDSLWGSCWLNRRAGHFQAGLLSAQRLINLSKKLVPKLEHFKINHLPLFLVSSLIFLPYSLICILSIASDDFSKSLFFFFLK